MSDPTRPNAVERRLALLLERWDAFASDPDPRVLCWTVAEDDVAIVDAFIQLQCDGRGAAADCFVRLDDPFDDPATYGATLAASLATSYGEVRGDLAAAGHGAAWEPLPAYPGDDAVAHLARACASFQAAHTDLGLTLAVVLGPAAIADGTEWARWVERLARAELPRTVRFLVVDVAESAQLQALRTTEPLRVRSEALTLDMAGARLDLARAADRGDAGSAFRLEYLALTAAAGRRDVPETYATAERALAIAVRQQWPAMQVAVYVAVAAACLGAARPDDAVVACQAARAAAQAAAHAGDPTAPVLIAQAGLSEGAALVSAGRWAAAGAVYESAAGEATDCGHHLFALEGWRMAAWCHTQLGDLTAAWRTGWCALDAGEQLDPDWRAASTLSIAGQALVAVARQHQWAEGVEAASQRLAALLAPATAPATAPVRAEVMAP